MGGGFEYFYIPFLGYFGIVYGIRVPSHVVCPIGEVDGNYYRLPSKLKAQRQQTSAFCRGIARYGESFLKPSCHPKFAHNSRSFRWIKLGLSGKWDGVNQFMAMMSCQGNWFSLNMSHTMLHTHTYIYIHTHSYTYIRPILPYCITTNTTGI